MEIETKFNVTDTVYFLYSEKVECGSVVRIDTTSHFDQVFEKQVTHISYQVSVYKNHSSLLIKDFKEECLFESIGSLTSFLQDDFLKRQVMPVNSLPF